MEEISIARTIFLNAGLQEAIKRGAPAYTYNNKNIVGIAAFKGHLGIWFHQGSFLSDPNKVFVAGSETTNLSSIHILNSYRL
ncbi:MAG: hypothetical protein ACI8ZN_002408 [Bacteroidia bacterium]|jgi:uncharacterized protein YdeI (YjbR/CyaY-like superfamily)